MSRFDLRTVLLSCGALALVACGSADAPPAAADAATKAAEEVAAAADQAADGAKDMADGAKEMVDEAKQAAEAAAEALKASAQIEPNGEVTVTSLKKGTIEDAHTMKLTTEQLSLRTPGDLSTLEGELTIHTSTWDSPVDVRDERVKSMFFQAALHPTAVFEVQSLTGVTTLAPGASAEAVAKGSLQVLSGEKDLTAKVKVTRGDAGYEFALMEPVTVTGTDLGLGDALQAVATACGVELSDSTKVMATFHLPAK